ncbi:hypothetical protein [Mesorhizobium sp.]|uniref:hypothetical protein n=1 Tax=Mesorhizobium sp. TaxID=1871066 RepID=UPI000FE79964|nr:hypothetical protein [Mesorhizobium sp.]RWE86941.1 MAG: hypothetical protein EOS49_11805 [Mesorhizobium sp.]
MNRWADLGIFWEDIPEIPYRNPNSPWRAGHDYERAVCADLGDFPFVKSTFNFRAIIADIQPVAPFDPWGHKQEGWRFVFRALGPSCISNKTWHEDVIRGCTTCCDDLALRRFGEIVDMINAPIPEPQPWQLIGIAFDASMRPS